MKNTKRIMTTVLGLGITGGLWAESANPPAPKSERSAASEEVSIHESFPNPSAVKRKYYAGPLMTIRRGDASGDRYTFDVFLSRTADLRGYQVGLSVNAVTDGEAPAEAGLILEEISVDQEREDYVFGSFAAFTATDVGGARLAGAMLDGGADVDEPAYLGTFIYRAAEDAEGEFEVRVRLEEPASGGLLRDSAIEPIEFRAGPPAKVAIDRTTSTAAKDFASE